MALMIKRLDDVSFDDIRRLVSDECEEGPTLEFKQELNAKKDKDKRDGCAS